MGECSSLSTRRCQNYFVRQNCISSSYTRATSGESYGLGAVCICSQLQSSEGSVYLASPFETLGGLPFGKLNKVCIDGRPNDFFSFQSLLGSRMISVFAICHFWVAEKYSYSYSVIFGNTNNIRIHSRSFLGN